MKEKLSFLFSQLPELNHDEKSSCLYIRLKGSVSSFIESFLEQRCFIAILCRFKQNF